MKKLVVVERPSWFGAVFVGGVFLLFFYLMRSSEVVVVNGVPKRWDAMGASDILMFGIFVLVGIALVSWGIWKFLRFYILKKRMRGGEAARLLLFDIEETGRSIKTNGRNQIQVFGSFLTVHKQVLGQTFYLDPYLIDRFRLVGELALPVVVSGEVCYLEQIQLKRSLDQEFVEFLKNRTDITREKV